MTKTRFQYPLLIALLTLWWGMTVIADVVVAPKIFQVVENFFNAGDLAMVIFTRVNKLEVVHSTLVMVLLAFNAKRNRNTVFFCITLLCWSFALFYFAYLIPKIISLTEIWKQADKMGVVGIGDIPDIQQAHQFFHRIYVTLDVMKLFILSGLLIFSTVKQERFA